jgi:glycosyltransferase involved in cell wall biosynthesis
VTVSEPQERPDPSTAVSVAYVHQHEVAYSFHHSMVALLDHDMSHDAHVWAGGYTAIRGGTDGLAHARNEAVKVYLGGDRADWLWWVDTDMGFLPDTVDRLLEAADPIERPVVGALCFANYEIDNDGMGGRYSVAAPVIMHWTHDGAEAGFNFRWNYPRDTLVRCDATGSACVLIHRSVLERVRDEYGEQWYSRARNPSTGELVGEDFSFCARLMALQIPVHVHTGVPTTHAKRVWLGEEDYWRQRALNAPPPAPTNPFLAAKHAERTWTVPRYAIIPTHNRPALLRALVWSLGSQCDHIVVLDNACDPPVDEAALAEAAGQARVTVLRDGEQPPNLARFWNVMFEHCAKQGLSITATVWDVAVLNDDSVVPVGWYDACSRGLREATAVIAHTDPTTPTLLRELGNVGGNRMCPHAFVIRGEMGLRADEDLRWWYFDSDLDQQARLAGGVLSVRGPRVINSLANTTTVGPLAEQAELDRKTFEAKWSR